jgi:hypothetical protein
MFWIFLIVPSLFAAEFIATILYDCSMDYVSKKELKRREDQMKKERDELMNIHDDKMRHNKIIQYIFEKDVNGFINYNRINEFANEVEQQWKEETK